MSEWSYISPVAGDDDRREETTMLRPVNGWEALDEATLGLKGRVLIAFVSERSVTSRNTRPELEAFAAAHPETDLFLVDVVATPDLHPRFKVAAVPTVAVVDDGAVTQLVVGAQTVASYEKALLGPALELAGRPAKDGEKPAHRVTVYTGPTCVWCTRVKAYLDEKKVRYKEVDVSRDERTAQELVKKTGQTGVPQLDIDGSWIVGFDKARIDKLLGL